MKKTIGFREFEDSFEKMGKFSQEGLLELFDYLEDYERETGEEIELDPISFCCEFTEYENLKEFQEAYSEEYETIEDIEEKTIVIRIEDSERFIISKF